MKKPWHERIYALYRGEQYITDGTIYEISEKTGREIESLKSMTYPSYRKRFEDDSGRLVMVYLDDE